VDPPGQLFYGRDRGILRSREADLLAFEQDGLEAFLALS
jgi:hypothetical protein